MAPGSTISYFIGSHRFLSNFYPCVVRYDGRLWASAEHAYHAAKTFNSVSKDYIRKADTAARAKNIGAGVLLRADWEDVKLDIMRDILAAKFHLEEKATRHGHAMGTLAEMLIATDPAHLMEGNHWHDSFWGCVPDGKGGWSGKNWLGKLLMDRRKQLKEG